MNDEVDYDTDFLCDMYEPTGLALRFLEIETAFRRAGYSVKSTELSPHRPPVAVFRLARTTAPVFSGQAPLVNHVRQILESAGITTFKSDLIAQQSGSRIIVSLLWRLPPPSGVEGLGLDELLALLP